VQGFERRFQRQVGPSDTLCVTENRYKTSGVWVLYKSPKREREKECSKMSGRVVYWIVDEGARQGLSSGPGGIPWVVDP